MSWWLAVLIGVPLLAWMLRELWREDDDADWVRDLYNEPRDDG